MTGLYAVHGHRCTHAKSVISACGAGGDVSAFLGSDVWWLRAPPLAAEKEELGESEAQEETR